MTHCLMLLSVLVRHALAAGQVLFHGRIYYQLLGDGMTSKLPCELVLPAYLGVIIFGAEDIVDVFIELLVVVDDGFGNSRLPDGRGGELTLREGGGLGTIDRG